MAITFPNNLSSTWNNLIYEQKSCYEEKRQKILTAFFIQECRHLDRVKNDFRFQIKNRY
jgi:hypothetical protein